MKNKRKSPVIMQPGELYETQNGTVEILEWINSKKVKARFVDTGTIVFSQAKDYRTGRGVKDMNRRSVYGVGYIGVGQHDTGSGVSGKHDKVYELWRGMIRRCYAPETHSEETVAAYKDCYVDERWHSYQNFCDDIQELPGYADWDKNNHKPFKESWCLDKDILGRPMKKKCYSKETCLFIPVVENSKEARARKLGREYTY